MVLNGTIYTTNKEEFIAKCWPDIKADIETAKSTTVGDVEVVEIKLPRNVPTRKRVRNGVEYTDIDWDWLKENYPPNGNFLCWHISRDERDRIGLQHSSHPSGSKLGGRYNRNMGDTSMEFIVIANSYKAFIRLFLHELSHGFSHWSNVTDRTHVFEDAGNWIGDLFASYDFTLWGALKALASKLTQQREILQDEVNTKSLMVNPEFLITHHGADARLLTIAEMRRIYQDTHFESLYKKYDQPRSSGDYPDIAYHILVGTDGWAYQRDLDVFGYHASNYPVNINSVAIVISGNYDNYELSPEMESYYREAVADVKTKLPSLKYVNGHRAYANKTCPGGTITNEFIKEVFDNPEGDQDVDEGKQKAAAHIGNALQDLSEAITELQ